MEIRLDGRRVRYAHGGRDHDPAQPGLVLVHGAGMNRSVWQLQTRHFAHRGCRAAALDLPGHGGSDGPPLADMGELGDWLADVIEALGLAPAHVVGHSMGTYVALEAAARNPDAIASLVLIGTAASMPVHPELLAAATDDVEHASRLMSSWGFGARAHVGRHAAPGMWLIGGSTALLDTSRPESLGIDMAMCNGYDGAVAAALACACPVTFVLGSLDKMTPPKRAQPLIDACGDAAVVTVEGAGHMIPVEAPDATREAIGAALSRVGFSSGGRRDPTTER